MKIKYYSEILHESFDSEKQLLAAEKRREKQVIKEKAAEQENKVRRNYLIDNLENFQDLPRLIEEATKDGRTKWHNKKLKPITNAAVTNVSLSVVTFKNEEREWWRNHPMEFKVNEQYGEISFTLSFKGSGFLSDYDLLGIRCGCGNGGKIYSQQSSLFIADFPKLQKNYEKFLKESEKYKNFVKKKQDIRTNSIAAKDKFLAQDKEYQSILSQISSFTALKSQIETNKRDYFISIEEQIPEVTEPKNFLFT